MIAAVSTGWTSISIHALLAESDRSSGPFERDQLHFYPRSPCGERLHSVRQLKIGRLFLSTLSLRRATSQQPRGTTRTAYFYPRSPCGERRAPRITPTASRRFLSTLSLRRATGSWRGLPCSPGHFYPRSPCGERPREGTSIKPIFRISIHALLAESDWLELFLYYQDNTFLSTLSLRRATRGPQHFGEPGGFLSTLSLRRATTDYRRGVLQCPIFLSTLSLRRATPCGGERQEALNISIHALLAESDVLLSVRSRAFSLFLSTLSLRRATPSHHCEFHDHTVFLSTLSLRRATRQRRRPAPQRKISIHALLAESDYIICQCIGIRVNNFYPRSPCGERPNQCKIY